jgi:hypothetical protein
MTITQERDLYKKALEQIYDKDMESKPPGEQPWWMRAARRALKKVAGLKYHQRYWK